MTIMFMMKNLILLQKCEVTKLMKLFIRSALHEQPEMILNIILVIFVTSSGGKRAQKCAAFLYRATLCCNLDELIWTMPKTDLSFLLSLKNVVLEIVVFMSQLLVTDIIMEERGCSSSSLLSSSCRKWFCQGEKGARRDKLSRLVVRLLPGLLGRSLSSSPPSPSPSPTSSSPV